MKKTLKKAIIAITAVALVSASVAISAFAKPTITPVIDPATKKVTVTVSDAADLGDQITILILKPGEVVATETAIAYINQEKSTENGAVYEFSGANLVDGTYEVRIGGSNASSFETADLIVGEVDPNKTPGPDATTAPTTDPDKTPGPDQTTPPVTGDYPVDIGDVNDDGSIDATDALHVLLVNTEQKDGFVSEGTKLNKGDAVKAAVGDVNADGTIDATDALHILLVNTEQRDGFDRTDANADPQVD